MTMKKHSIDSTMSRFRRFAGIARSVRSTASRLAAPAAVLAILALAVPAAGQDATLENDARIDAARARYDADAWPAGEAHPGLPLASLRFDGYHGEAVTFTAGAPAVTRFADATGEPRFLVEVSVCDSASGAHNVLAGCLSYISSPRPVPSAAELGIAVGDAGYVGRAPAGRIAWIAFVRGNIAVRLSCLDPRAEPHPDMAGLAGTVDRLILAQPVLAAGEPVGRPSVVRCLPARSVCRAGESVSIDLEVLDPGGEPAAIQWEVGGPGQGYVEKDNSGRWVLHTTREGSIRLTCRVLGALGTTANSETWKIEVAPELD
jgi:hypothetical protein